MAGLKDPVFAAPHFVLRGARDDEILESVHNSLNRKRTLGLCFRAFGGKTGPFPFSGPPHFTKTGAHPGLRRGMLFVDAL